MPAPSETAISASAAAPWRASRQAKAVRVRGGRLRRSYMEILSEPVARLRCRDPGHAQGFVHQLAPGHAGLAGLAGILLVQADHQLTGGRGVLRQPGAELRPGLEEDRHGVLVSRPTCGRCARSAATG